MSNLPSQTPPERKCSEYDQLLLKSEAYMIIGDLDKPFHRPECACLEKTPFLNSRHSK